MSSSRRPSPPDRDTAPVVQRLRIRYARRGRLRFSSHRDFQRALERALRRAAIPIGYSAGFTPHPRISYAGAAPVGSASEAEYAELGVTRRLEPTTVRAELDAALPPGLDILEVVEVPREPRAAGSGGATGAAGATGVALGLADRLEASSWEIELPGLEPEALAAGVEAFERARAAGPVIVVRMTRNGRRELDIGPAVLRIGAGSAEGRPSECREASGPCAILHVVVRQDTPAVRPDDVLAGLRSVSGLGFDAAQRAMRRAQGPWDEESGTVGDPLAPDRDASAG